MKTGTLILITWLGVFTVQAQKTIEKKIEFSGKEALELNIQIADSIKIQTWNKNEVYVKATVDINENKDNEAYMTSFEDKNGKIVVNANFMKDYFKGKNNCCNESNIYWQVYIPEMAAFSVESINADITITGKTEEINVKSISGYIDLAVPEKQSAEIEFSTISGTIYSNHSLAPTGIKHGAHSAIEGKLNSGGPLIRLETISGDIFFRKSI